MYTTSPTLLERLQQPQAEPDWDRFVDLYTPLFCRWASRFQIPDDEALDLVQELLMTLVVKLPAFQYEASGSFRSWLRTVSRNLWLSRLRRKRIPMAEAGDVELVADDPDDGFWDQEYEQHLTRQALKIMQSDFQESTWQAAWDFIVEGKPGSEVAATYGLTVGAVYAARVRVLTRLREELRGLLD